MQARKRGSFRILSPRMSVHPVTHIPKILDLLMEPVMVSHMINLEGYNALVW